MSDLVGVTMAHRRLVEPGVCWHWLPVWLPNLVSAANLRWPAACFGMGLAGGPVVGWAGVGWWLGSAGQGG